MGFWSDAFDNLGDNLTLLGKAAEDLGDNLNPFSDQFASGDAKNTAAEAERQNAERAGREFSQERADASAKGGLEQVRKASAGTVADAGKTVGRIVDGGAKVAGTGLDLLTNPYVLAGIAAVVLAILVAPYAAPVVAKAIK